MYNFIFIFKDIYWPKSWEGIEYQIKWDILNMFPRQLFSQVIRKFFSLTKTKVAWNSGFLNHDCGCDVMITCSNNQGKKKIVLHIYKHKMIDN